MNLGDIITTLEAANPNQVIRHGFHNPHSYRGDYYDLAFEPAENITVADMLEAARSAVGATYQGWKGGDFRMTEADWCWLSEEGSASGETISPLLLKFMLTPPVSRADVYRDAADAVEQTLIHGVTPAASERDEIWDDAVRAVATELRRKADEAQPGTEAQAPGAIARVERLALAFEVSGNEFIAERIRAAMTGVEAQPGTEPAKEA